jgi:hypothetical protein
MDFVSISARAFFVRDGSFFLFINTSWLVKRPVPALTPTFALAPNHASESKRKRMNKRTLARA